MSISLLTPHTVLAQTNTEEKKVDYYYEGEDTAKRDYSGGTAMLGGLASGFLLAYIGWGIGYLVVRGQSVDVPRRYTTDLDRYQRRDFEDGYIDYVKKKRKTRLENNNNNVSKSKRRKKKQSKYKKILYLSLLL